MKVQGRWHTAQSTENDQLKGWSLEAWTQRRSKGGQEDGVATGKVVVDWRRRLLLFGMDRAAFACELLKVEMEGLCGRWKA